MIADRVCDEYDQHEVRNKPDFCQKSDCEWSDYFCVAIDTILCLKKICVRWSKQIWSCGSDHSFMQGDRADYETPLFSFFHVTSSRARILLNSHGFW